MKKLVSMLLCSLMVLIASAASACGTFVVIYDSDTRLLFEEELRGYHYDTLGYILNEILARHGYHFDPDGRYYEHFQRIDYREPHDTGFPYKEAPASVSNEEIIANLSNTELKNIALIKQIISEKREAHDESGLFVDWMCSESWDSVQIPVIGEPRRVDMPINLKIPVYSGPGERYLRGANDAAMVSTNDDILAYGFDGDWLMINYIVDKQKLQRRVGYIHKDEFRRELDHPECYEDSEYGYSSICDPVKQLEFTHVPMTLTADAILTDDPASTQTPLVSLRSGEAVTVLMTFPAEESAKEKGVDWAYVEYSGKKPVRGFVELALLE